MTFWPLLSWQEPKTWLSQHLYTLWDYPRIHERVWKTVPCCQRAHPLPRLNRLSRLHNLHNIEESWWICFPECYLLKIWRITRMSRMILVWNYEVLIWCSATITCFRYFSSAIYRFPIPWFQRVTDTGNSCQCPTSPRTCSVGRFPPRVAFLHVFGVPGAEGVWSQWTYSIDKIHKRYKDCWDWFILFVLELLFESLFSWESYISRY